MRPGLDDKILTGWNALMNLAFSTASAVLGDPEYLATAERNMQFLWGCREKSGALRHSYKEGAYRFDAFLDDHAYLIWAMTGLHQAGGEEIWLGRAVGMMEEVDRQFSDEEGRFYYYTAEGQADVIVRKKEIYDGATPSGNAIMALNGWRLGILAGQERWKRRAMDMADGVLQVATRYPTSFGVWSSLLMELVTGTWEIAIVGEAAREKYKALLLKYLPFRVGQWAVKERADQPLLEGKLADGKTMIYLCRDYACKQPVENVEDLFQLIESELLAKKQLAQ